MWTNKEIIKTGINIDTVKESKLNPHKILTNSESIQVNNIIFTIILLNPTSQKIIKVNMVVIKTEIQVINLDPVTPIFLP